MSAFQIFNSLYYGFNHSGIDNAGHMGGLIGGFVIMSVWFLVNKRESENFPVTFAGATAIAFLFALLVMPKFVPPNQLNPRAYHKQVSQISDLIIRIELQAIRKSWL